MYTANMLHTTYYLLNRLRDWTQPMTSFHWISATLLWPIIVDWELLRISPNTCHPYIYFYCIYIYVSNRTIFWEAGANSFTLHKLMPSYAMTSRLLHQSTSSFFLGQPEAEEGGSHTCCCIVVVHICMYNKYIYCTVYIYMWLNTMTWILYVLHFLLAWKWRMGSMKSTDRWGNKCKWFATTFAWHYLAGAFNSPAPFPNNLPPAVGRNWVIHLSS